MKQITRFLLILLGLVLTSFVGVFGEFDPEVTSTGEATYQIVERTAANNLGYGITHFTDISKTTREGLTYNQQVNVMEIPADSPARIISYANLGSHVWTLTTVTNLAARFEENNPDWRVLGAINADFFDINAVLNGLPYQTNNPVVTDGEFYKTSVRSGVLGFTNDGTTNTLVAGKTDYRTENLILGVYDVNDEIVSEFTVENINVAPGEGQTSVYYGIYNSSTHIYEPKVMDSGSFSTFVIESAELALPNNENDFYGKGTISSNTAITLEKGQFAVCTSNSAMISALAIGTKIRTQFEFVGDFANVTSATGYQGHFLSSGEYLHDTPSVLAARHPRTVVGVKTDGTIVMTVIDGRQTVLGMDGMFDNEMAATMKRYGCQEAYNLDGGGSTTMIIRKNGQFVVTNSPSDGALRRDGNCLLIAVKMPTIELNVVATADSLEFDVDLVSNNGHDIQTLFLEVNGIKQESTGAPLMFSDLTHDTGYYYQFSYLDSQGLEHTLLNDGICQSLKIPPEFIRLEIAEAFTFYEITIIYDDPDGSGAFLEAQLTINGRLYTVRRGETIIKQSDVSTNLETIVLEFSYDLNDGQIILVNQTIEFLLISSVECLLLEDLYAVSQTAITDLYH